MKREKEEDIERLHRVYIPSAEPSCGNPHESYHTTRSAFSVSPLPAYVPERGTHGLRCTRFL